MFTVVCLCPAASSQLYHEQRGGKLLTLSKARCLPSSRCCPRVGDSQKAAPNVCKWQPAACWSVCCTCWFQGVSLGLTASFLSSLTFYLKVPQKLLERSKLFVLYSKERNCVKYCGVFCLILFCFCLLVVLLVFIFIEWWLMIKDQNWGRNVCMGWPKPQLYASWQALLFRGIVL